MGDEGELGRDSEGNEEWGRDSEGKGEWEEGNGEEIGRGKMEEVEGWEWGNT